MASTLSGCAVPVTVAAAGYAVSGFTLLDQGKTLSDVVLSAALDQDCAMWRIIQDQPICINAPDERGLVADAEVVMPAELAELDGKVHKSSMSN